MLINYKPKLSTMPKIITEADCPEEKLGDLTFNILYGTLLCFDQLSDPTRFTKWMQKNYKNIPLSSLLDGYKLYISSIVGLFSRQISDDSLLGLTDSIAFNRAIFNGTTPDKIPQTCEKAQLLYILQQRLQAMNNAKKFSEYKPFLSSLKKDVLSIFQKHFENNAYTDLPEPIEKYPRILKQWVTENFFCDTSHGAPLGYVLSPLRSALEPLVEGTEAYDRYIYSEEAQMMDPSIIGYAYVMEFLLNELFPGLLNEEIKEELHCSDKWDTIDHLFTYVDNFAFEKRREKYGRGSYMRPFKIEVPFPNKSLIKIIANATPSKLSLKEELHQKLLWYEVGLLDSTSAPFTGELAFSTLLQGAIQIRKKNKTDDPIQIRRFLHPNHMDNGNDYSYAILLERFGMFTDYSGWLVCYDCATDYSGMGGQYHDLIENTLEEYKSKLEIESMTIPKNKFFAFMIEVDVAPKGSDLEKIQGEFIENNSTIIRLGNDNSSLKNKLERSHDLNNELTGKWTNLQGLSFELVTYYFITQKYKIVSDFIDWNVSRGGNQIDVILKNEDTMIFIECKVSLALKTVDKELKKFSNKIKDWNTPCQKEGLFYVYDRPSQKVTDMYESWRKTNTSINIRDFVVMSDLFNLDPIWNGKDCKDIKNTFSKHQQE